MKISATLAVSLIIFLGVFSQWLAWKISKPAIVIMSLAGLIVGPFLNIIVPSQVLGDSIYKSIISISVALILFEGSLSLDFKEITDTKMTIKRIVVFGALISWILGSLSAYFLAGLSITTSLVIGALLIVTGTTVIIAQLDSKVSTILKWEGFLVDPMGAILAVLSFEAAEVFASSSVSPGILVKFGIGVLIAVAIGGLVGIGTGRALQKNYFPEYLKSAIVLCLVLGTFSLSESITHETGLLAVTVMGVILANMHISSIEQVKHFNENISILLTSSVFVMLTSSLSRSILVDIFQLKIILFVLSMLFIVRPLSIWLSTIGTDLNIREKTLIGWIAPRGIVALTVTGYFSNLLVEEGHQDAELLLALTFALVIVTVIAHGFSIQPLAKKLGLAHDGKPGLVIVGSNPFSVALAKFLKDWDVPSLIVDYSGKNLENVINTDIETYQGEILYEVANYNLDLVIYKKMLLNTPIPLYNILVSNEFVSRFEHTSSICIINVLGDKVRSDFKELQKIGVPRLGDYRATYLSLIRLVEDGYDFAATQITEELTEEEYYRLMDYRRINIFTMTESGDIEFFTTEHKPRISSGDYIVSLTPPSPDDTGQHLEFTTSRADFNTIQNS